MRDEVREALERCGEYISVGVTETGEGYSAIPVPWDHTSNAYNMKIPDVYLRKEDLADAEVMARLKAFKVVGFYSYVPLDDYDFLREFPHIFDLTLLRGETLRDVAFLEELTRCRMLYLERVTVKDLNPLLRAKRSAEGGSVFARPYVCVGLCDCQIGDVSGFDDPTLFFSEFLVWNPKERDERERWRGIRRGAFRYRTIDD